MTSLIRRTLFDWGIGMMSILLLGYCWPLSGQNREQIRLADTYYQNGYFEKAIPLYQAYVDERPKDHPSLLKLAICQYESNALEESISNLEQILENDKHPEDEVYLRIAQAYHQKHDFERAIRFYKEFVSSSVENQDRKFAIDQIKRCAIGLRFNYTSTDVLVENLGKEVNSSFEDFQPMESPNHPAKMYFSSIRNATVVDEFTENGTLTGTNTGRDCDMYSSEIVNGAWGVAQAMNPQLNTGQHEILQHFRSDGLVVYFSRGNDLDHTTTYVDTFRAEGSEGLGTEWLDPPFGKDTQTRGIQFWSDSLIIYSASYSGEMDGFDIYFVRKKNGNWQQPVEFEIGKEETFDLVSPFLAKDGRTLYFSSNNLLSMGGFDVFRSTFNETDLTWSEPENLGRPINSAGDDMFYRISDGGSMAYFSSSRKSGYGCQDIYTCYFREIQQEQVTTSIPSIFYEVAEFRLFSESMDTDAGELKLAQYEVPVLFYRDDQVLTPQNTTKILDLANFLKTYPHLNLEIICHSDQMDVSNFDLFFSIKRSEEVASALHKEGIDFNRLYLKGVGGSYPIVQGSTNRLRETTQFLNRRIDFRVHNPKQLPLEITYDMPEVSEALKTGFVEDYYDQASGLTYRIQFAATDQLFKGDLIGQYPHPSAEKNPSSDLYFYCSGIFRSFEASLQHLTEIKERGYTDAKVVPYLEGIRLSNGQMEPELLTRFPDLKNYILYLE